MRADPVFATIAAKTLRDYPGYQVSSSKWVRGYVNATVYQRDSSSGTMSPLPYQAVVRQILAGMQSRGWTIYFAGCKPPPGQFTATEWDEQVFAYRIYQGTSYWADVGVDVNDDFGLKTGYSSDVAVAMLAPAATEPAADLFPDHPAALPLTSVCAAQPSVPQRIMQQGPDIAVSTMSLNPSRPSPRSTLR